MDRFDTQAFRLLAAEIDQQEQNLRDQVSSTYFEELAHYYARVGGIKAYEIVREKMSEIEKQLNSGEPA